MLYPRQTKLKEKRAYRICVYFIYTYVYKAYRNA